MQTAFEIVSFPDLSLPRYYDLFGDEALQVVATRLFTWLQITTSTRQQFSFTIRYTYDPIRSPSNRRLRIYVILTAMDNAPADPLLMGRRLAGEVLQIQNSNAADVAPPVEDLEFLSILERKETLLLEKAEALYLPAVWTRQTTARNALEPYLDEAFAALSSPAFLDIQLHACEPASVRQTLRSVADQLERRKQSSAGAETHSLHFQALAEALAGDPVCRMLIFAGSRERQAADGLLRAFGVDAIGGSRFKVTALSQGDSLHSALTQAATTGAYEFRDAEGWFSRSLRTGVEGNSTGLSGPQITTLKQLSELSVLAGVDLIRDVVTLPIPRRGYLRTFPLETEQDRQTVPITLDSKPTMIRLGKSLERQEPIELPVADLPRHAFIAGVTGSGKTVTMLNILRQLAEQDIPFLVFEPAKAEYRRLAQFSALHRRLRVYTPGRDALSPLRLNPFTFDSHVTLASHIAGLSAAFNTALGLFQPVNTILEEALWELYEACGWQEDDLGNSRPDLPRVEDIPERVCKIIESLGYDPEVSGRFKGVIRSRFIRLSRGSVGRLFDCSSSLPPVSELCKAQSIIELNTLTQQEANLVTMFLLMAIREHLSASAPPDGRPRLVMVLEEAHNLVPSIPDESAGGEETSAKIEASRYISNMLAEMRAMGLAILVVDQSPAAVAAQVVRNTNLKIAHRTVAKQDRETLADAMLMHPAHAELLGRLVPGQAYVYADRFFRPYLMQGVLVTGDTPITKTATTADSRPPSDLELAEWLRTADWFKDTVKTRIHEATNRVNETARMLSTFFDRVRSEFEQLTKVSDYSEWESVRSRLRASWQEELKIYTQRLRSLHVEQRAIARTAPGLRLKTVLIEKLDGLDKMKALIAEATLQLDGIQPTTRRSS